MQLQLSYKVLAFWANLGSRTTGDSCYLHYLHAFQNSCALLQLLLLPAVSCLWQTMVKAHMSLVNKERKEHSLHQLH